MNWTQRLVHPSIEQLTSKLENCVNNPLYDKTYYRSEVRYWLDLKKDMLAVYRSPNKGHLEDTIPKGLELQGLLYDAQWTRYGWPIEAGGLGGSMALRGILYDELTAAGYQVPESLEILEIIGPMLVRYAPAIAKIELPLALSGKQVWCQGFSEPSAGSDLARLETKAKEEGEGFRINGQKIWTSLGHLSQRCGVLARTGSSDSAHKGLSMFWVDLSTPGVTVCAIKAASGHNEFSEVFFDDVYIPKNCLIGSISQGWEVAMYLLQFERGMYAWMRQAWLHTRLENAIRLAGDLDSVDSTADEIGAAYLKLLALRLKSKLTVDALSEGKGSGPEISVDKILLGTSERLVTESARRLLGSDFLSGSNEIPSAFRADWFWARASSIFGGAIEIQRDVVAERILGLPKGRRFGN